MGGKGGWTILQDLGGGAGVLTVDLNMSDMLEIQPGDDQPLTPLIRLSSFFSITSSSVGTLQYGIFQTIALSSADIQLGGQSPVKPSGMSDEQLVGSKWSGGSAGGDLVLSVRFQLRVEARQRLLAWPHHLGVETLNLQVGNRPGVTLLSSHHSLQGGVLAEFTNTGACYTVTDSPN